MPTVLLVDDDPDHQALYHHILSTAGYEVWAGDTVRHALALLEAYRFDVAVLDARLPDGDGYDLCLTLRQRAETAALPVLMLSADARAGHARRALAAGVDDCLSKPVARAELVARLGSLITRRATGGVPPGHAALLAAHRLAEAVAPARPAGVSAGYRDLRPAVAAQG